VDSNQGGDVPTDPAGAPRADRSGRPIAILALLAALLLPYDSARAEDSAPADTSAAPRDTSRAPADSSATPEEETAPWMVPATPEEVAGQVEGLNEVITVMQTDLDKLKRIKITGFLQARWEDAESDRDSVQVVGSPATYTTNTLERFYIRRARLKVTYDASPWGQLVTQIDGGADRQIRLIDAYGALYDWWTVDHDHQLWIGQFNVPFGYEIETADLVRELPERSRAENILFPGERDRGVKLQDLFGTHFETALAVINGGGINSADFPTTDPTRGKDVLGRARVVLGFLDAGVSGYTGKQTTPLTGPDVETDRTRYGGEIQCYYALPVVGGGALKAEAYRGHNVNSDSVSTLIAAPTSANPVRLLKPGADPGHLATDFDGGYVTWVQNIKEFAQVAVRYDWWDPNVDVDHDQFHRVGIALHAFYQGQVRVTLAYEIPTTERALAGGGYEDPGDNMWTAQFQFQF
jgi:hypothetical protein